MHESYSPEFWSGRVGLPILLFYWSRRLLLASWIESHNDIPNTLTRLVFMDVNQVSVCVHASKVSVQHFFIRGTMVDGKIPAEKYSSGVDAEVHTSPFHAVS